MLQWQHLTIHLVTIACNGEAPGLTPGQAVVQGGVTWSNYHIGMVS
jgi:hypothetical protein